MQLRSLVFCVGHGAPRSNRVVQGRFGGSQFGDGSGRQQQKPPKLIIPGQNNNPNPPRPGGSLIVPTNPNTSPGGGADVGIASSDSPILRNFRPPPGFMDDGGVKESEVLGTPQEMLNRLQAQAGHWHQLAKLLPALNNAGYDSNVVEEMTGLERKVQNIWTSAAQIYEALSKSGDVSESVLSHFDLSGGEYLMYELRFLTNQQRKAAVAYIADQNLDAAACLVLARAIKEHERRAGHRDGFTNSPADCLAYKYYRDALECRNQENMEVCVKKGLEVVESEKARLKLESMVDGKEVPFTQALPSVVLSVMRLDKEEVGYRPIHLVGPFETTTADDVRRGLKVSTVAGMFGSFHVPSEGATAEWVPLPAWAIVSLATLPVGLYVENCADLEALKETAKAKTQDEIRKLQGPGLLVLDAEPSGEAAIDPGKYYGVEGVNGGVDLVPGSEVEGKALLGPVLFLCRPPNRDTVGATTAELLSL